MGIDVFDSGRPRMVALNQTHEKRVVTAVASNPSRSAVGSIPVINVFRRTKTGDVERDGNPLIYALKGINGYAILPCWRERIMNLATQILASIHAELAAFDHVIAVPSSNAFCSDFAALVSKATGVPLLTSACVRKKTVSEMLAGFRTIPSTVRPQHRQAFGRQLKEWRSLPPGSAVSMKLISPFVRPHLDPFTATGHLPALAGRKILIVDDLLSSGSSIASVAGILRSQGATVSALCFLSAI